MFRRALPFLLLALLLAAPASAQVPTLQLGAAGGISILPPGPITSDGSRVSLTLVVSETGGKLSNGVRFKGSSASAGRFDAECSQVGPGTYSCGYTTPEGGTREANLKIKARLASGSELEAVFPLSLVSEAKGRVTMNATPDRVILTQDPTSTLMFNVVDKGGRPVEGVELAATANVGEVQAVTPLTGGNYSAIYVPPTTPFPQVAIVSVWDKNRPSRTFGFFTIPLIGKVSYPVNAQAPGVTLVFKVGDQTFPPAVTDASGVARVPITVPPGVSHAEVELIQGTGARSTQKIDLQVPPFNRVALGALPDFLVADGASKTKIRLFAVDGRGRPADGQNIQLSTTQGTVDAVRFVRDGIYEAVFTAPKLDTTSRATITAVIVGHEASSSDTVEIGLEPGTPDSLTLTSDPAQITPKVTKSTLTATISEKSGTASETYKIEFRTLEGPLGNPRAVGPGVFQADVPVAWNVKKTVSAIAAIRGNKRAVGGVVAFPLEDVVLTGQKMPVTVVTLDRYGNPVADTPLNVTVTSGGGSVTTSVQTNDKGLGTVLYSAGPLPGLATIRFEAGGSTYEVPLWQSQEPVKDLHFPVSGGQKQGKRVARWRKLHASISLGVDQVAVVAPPTASGDGVWGAGTSDGTDTTVVQDGGSVAPAGQASTIHVTTVPGSVPANGGTVNILVRVVDSGGILVAGEQVILLADGGTISDKVNNGDGTTSALLTVPGGFTRPQVQVTGTRPAGDLAGFATVTVGGTAAVAEKTPKTKKPKTKKPKAEGDDDRMANRFAQVSVGWAPGAYLYDSTPCANTGDGECGAVAESLLNGFDFLKTRIRAATLGSFSIKGEVFPIEYVGAAVSYTRLSYTTDFQASTGGGGGYCSTHFCDGMNFLNIDVQGRLPLLKANGPLDLLARVGYMAQDVVMFRRVVDLDDGEKKPQFDTVALHGLRVGVGARYTIIPMLRPHVDYNMTIGLGASFAGTSFSLTGVTNHNLAIGLNVFPFKGLLVDLSYDLTTRSLTLRYPNEVDVLQRGRINEQMHTVRLSAGWAF